MNTLARASLTEAKECLNSCSTAESLLQIVTLGTFVTADQSNWHSIMGSALRAALSSDRQVSLSSLSWGSITITSRIQRKSSKDNAGVRTLFSYAIPEIDARVKGTLPRRPKIEAGEMPWMRRFCSSLVSVTRLVNEF
jgi:hypothetical protein